MMRMLTAIAFIVICGVSVAQGWGIVRFFLASMNIVSSEKRAEIVDAWRTKSGITSTALEDELADETNQSDMIAPYRRRELLSAILSIKPMSSMDWLSLSSTELITHRPMGDVLGSLMLSMLTGPNEGYVMTDRGILGTSIWESLSPDLKRRVAADLTAVEIVGNGKFRAIVSAKPMAVQNELREALLATGLSRKEVEQRLGF